MSTYFAAVLLELHHPNSNPNNPNPNTDSSLKLKIGTFIDSAQGNVHINSAFLLFSSLEPVKRQADGKRCKAIMLPIKTHNNITENVPRQQLLEA